MPQVMVHGYHLSDQVKSYADSVQIIQAMKAAPLNGNTVRFYVIGGEVGHNTHLDNKDVYSATSLVSTHDCTYTRILHTKIT